MKIIIAGAGEVGYHIGKLLSIESNDIVIIDTDKEKLQSIENKLDVFIQVGDCTSFETLREARIENTDIFISVTEQQNSNLVAALIAKKLGAKKTIARVTNPEYLKRENLVAINRIGIDSIISPEDLAAKEVFDILEESIFSDVHAYEKGILYSYSARLDEDAKPLLGNTVKEVSEAIRGSINFTPIAIIREDKQKNLQTIIPRGDTRFRLNDKVYFIATPKAKHSLYTVLGKNYDPLKNVIILGGGRVGRKLAKYLIKSKHSVVMIERNRKIAESLAEQFPKNLIICGDGRDGDILEEAGILESDAFIAVTGRSETNMMSSLLANHKGVTKTIALVENVDYINLAEDAGIGAFVNKKLLAANAIFKHVRKGEVLDVFHLSELDAEFLEFKVEATCQSVGKKISDLKFPKQSIVGGVIREEKGYIPSGDFEFQKFDKVIVFSLPVAISKVEKIFTKQ